VAKNRLHYGRDELDARYGVPPSRTQGMQGDPRGFVERALGALNRRFVSSVPHQKRSWDDSPERRAKNLREQYKAQGLRRP
jgi:hypothetical protein